MRYFNIQRGKGREHVAFCTLLVKYFLINSTCYLTRILTNMLLAGEAASLLKTKCKLKSEEFLASLCNTIVKITL